MRYVLEGSAQKSGTRVRVDAQLLLTPGNGRSSLGGSVRRPMETDLHHDAGRGRHSPCPGFTSRIDRGGKRAASRGRTRKIRTPKNSPCNARPPIFALGPYRGKCCQLMPFASRPCRSTTAMFAALVILAQRLAARVYNLQSVDPQADGLRADELMSRARAVDSNNYLAHYARSFLLAPQRRRRRLQKPSGLSLSIPSFLPAYLSLWTANWTAGRTEKAIEYADAAFAAQSPRLPCLCISQR